jgi:hypothetical protein
MIFEAVSATIPHSTPDYGLDCISPVTPVASLCFEGATYDSWLPVPGRQMLR